MMAETAFDPHDCRAEVWWHADLACWALRLTHDPTGIQVTRYAGHGEAPGAFVAVAWPTAIEDLRWLVEHQGPTYPIPSACGIRI
jgi:hypothetical protein